MLPGQGTVVPVFLNLTLRAAGSQQKLASIYSRLHQRWESALHASAPANRGACRAAPCPSVALSVPTRTARSCAGLRQPSGSSWIPGHAGWDGRRGTAWLGCPRCGPVLYMAKCSWSTGTGPDQPALLFFHFLNGHTPWVSPNAIFSFTPLSGKPNPSVTHSS